MHISGSNITLETVGAAGGGGRGGGGVTSERFVKTAHSRMSNDHKTEWDKRRKLSRGITKAADQFDHDMLQASSLPSKLPVCQDIVKRNMARPLMELFFRV